MPGVQLGTLPTLPVHITAPAPRERPRKKMPQARLFVSGGTMGVGWGSDVTTASRGGRGARSDK